MNDIYEKVALELGLSVVEVKKAYCSMWEFARKKIKELDCSSEEKFNSQKRSFKISRLGKLYGFWKKGRRSKNENQNV